MENDTERERPAEEQLNAIAEHFGLPTVVRRNELATIVDERPGTYTKYTGEWTREHGYRKEIPYLWHVYGLCQEELSDGTTHVDVEPFCGRAPKTQISDFKKENIVTVETFDKRSHDRSRLCSDCARRAFGTVE